MNEKYSVYLTDKFLRDIKKLRKKYRNIKFDLDSAIQRLENGILEGDRLTGIGIPVFKIRLESSDMNKGKRSGIRIVYFTQLEKEIFLISAYAKGSKESISKKEILEIVKKYIPE